MSDRAINEIYKPHYQTFHKQYHGEDEDLKGKWALVGFTFIGGATIAQFDDESTGKGSGWWPMKHSYFWDN